MQQRLLAQYSCEKPEGYILLTNALQSETGFSSRKVRNRYRHLPSSLRGRIKRQHTVCETEGVHGQMAYTAPVDVVCQILAHWHKIDSTVLTTPTSTTTPVLAVGTGRKRKTAPTEAIPQDDDETTQPKQRMDQHGCLLAWQVKEADDTSCQCDECGKPCDMSWTCRTCNYDLCVACATQSEHKAEEEEEDDDKRPAGGSTPRATPRARPTKRARVDSKAASSSLTTPPSTPTSTTTTTPTASNSLRDIGQFISVAHSALETMRAVLDEDALKQLQSGIVQSVLTRLAGQ